MDKKDPPVRESAPPKPRRVYKSAAVGAGEAGMHTVLLDGRSALTPLRRPLATRARALAEAVAAEWQAQDPHVNPETMPLTRLLATEIDRVAPQREAVIDSLLSYVDADAICYRASHPADLCARQEALWRPVLEWLARARGVALESRVGAMPASQAPAAAAGMRGALAAMSDSALTAFQAAASHAGSLALAFALVDRHLSAEAAFAAAFLDEIYQAEKWGEDKEAGARRLRIARDLAAVERYLALAAG